jgi:hypothetical protein
VRSGPLDYRYRMNTRLIAPGMGVAAALLVCNTALASDFRALDFGASCENLPALEAQRGALPFEERLPSGYQYAFRGQYLDRDAVIVYACRDGTFFRGGYILAAQSEADASALYRKLKQTVSRERGAPSYDFASSEYRQKMQSIGATLSKADTEVAFWNDAHSEAHLSVGEPSGSRGWRVTLSYTAGQAGAE